MNTSYVAIVPHYLNSLKYFDKLYKHFLLEKIEILYLFPPKEEMKNYCIQQKKKYEIIESRLPKQLEMLFRPLSLFQLKKRVKAIIRKYDLKLIILTFDILYRTFSPIIYFNRFLGHQFF